MSEKTPVAIAYGDGIGPEIMAATLQVLEQAGAKISAEPVEIGEKAYLRGSTSGIDEPALEILRRTRVFLKAPISVPQGGGYKSLNVSARKTLGLFANVRPCVSYDPFVTSRHPGMDVVVIRENEEDVYAGMEYRLSRDETESSKLISRPGTEKIVRYAFEYARGHKRKKIACFTKDKVLKMTDGLFHKVFDEVAACYPEVQHEHWDVDLGAAKLADTPEAFDVAVMPNLYGDILSDVAAQVAGSMGLAASANIGDHCAMFEAVHGSAPRRANQNLANPSGLILASVLMLVHIRQPEAGERVHNAWLRTIEDGVHTYDIFSPDISSCKVGTREFARAVIERLGQKPNILRQVSYERVAETPLMPPRAAGRTVTAERVGVDVYVEWAERNPHSLAAALEAVDSGGMKLTLISNRGVRVWPGGSSDTFCTDGFRCRYLAPVPAQAGPRQVAELLRRLAEAGLEVVKTEALRNFDGQAGYSLAQGE